MTKERQRIASRPSNERKWRGPGIGVVVAVAAALTIGLPVLLLGGPEQQDASFAGHDGIDLVGSQRQVSAAEVVEIVVPGTQAILDAPGYEGTRVIYFKDQIAISTWAIQSSDGDFKAVQYIEPSAFLELFSLGAPAPALTEVDDEPVPVAAVLSVAASAHRGEEGEAWEAIDLSPMFQPLGIDLEGMSQGDQDFFYTHRPEDVEYFSQNTSDGGSLWTLTKTDGSSVFRQQWGIHPDGHLRFYAVEYPGPAPFQLEVDLSPLDERPSLDPPLTGSPVDIGHLDVPSHVPRPSASS